MMAIPPVVHSERDRAGFIPTLISIARSTGKSAYVDAGDAIWPAVHTLDLARLYRLALERPPSEVQLFSAAESGVRVRDIAEAIARRLEVPAISVSAEDAPKHFGGFAPLMLMRFPPMSSRPTEQSLGWTPTHATVLEDLERGSYFRPR